MMEEMRMKEILLPYGRTRMPIHVPEKNLAAVIAPPEAPADDRPEEQIVRDALARPVMSAPLCELARGKKRITVITSDHTRPVPSAITMPILLEELRRGQSDAEITILVATGMHRPTTGAELTARFGEDIARRERIKVHNAFDMADMVFLGTLPSGGELWLDSLVDRTDLLIAEGFIEPHFFAGFSGGRKAVLPGIASEKTVRYNHNAGFIDSPFARQGILEGNPIHKDMLYAAEKAGLAFILNVIIDDRKRIIAAVAGDPVRAHEAGCALSLERTAVRPVTADIAVTTNGGYPLDQNVYQSVKGMTAAEACVKQGGVIIMCAGAADGSGGESFYHWFSDRPGAKEVLEDIRRIPASETLPDQWEAQILARIQEKARVIFVTGNENRRLIEDMHMQWAPDADSALKAAFALTSPDAAVTVIPDGVGVVVTDR